MTWYLDYFYLLNYIIKRMRITYFILHVLDLQTTFCMPVLSQRIYLIAFVFFFIHFCRIFLGSSQHFNVNSHPRLIFISLSKSKSLLVFFMILYVWLLNITATVFFLLIGGAYRISRHFGNQQF